MDKNIGFRRNIYLSWMDAAAAYCIETPDPVELRARLDPVVAQQISSPENRRMAIDILINIWAKSADAHRAFGVLQRNTAPSSPGAQTAVTSPSPRLSMRVRGPPSAGIR